jgi:hypothetical protein
MTEDLVRRSFAHNVPERHADPQFLRSRAAAYRAEAARTKDPERAEIYRNLSKAFDVEADVVIARQRDATT